jgi:hypothetical protein
LCVALQLMRRILDSPGQFAEQLRVLINKAKQAQSPLLEAASNDAQVVRSPAHTAATAATSGAAGSGAAAAQPLVVQLIQEADRLVQVSSKKELQLPLSMAEALLTACGSLEQEQQQMSEVAGSSAGPTAGTAAAAESGIELGLTPKEVFVLQLVRECCGPAAALKQEKVVVYSQVRGGKALAAACVCRACARPLPVHSSAVMGQMELTRSVPWVPSFNTNQ